MVVRQIPRQVGWPSGDSRDLAELRFSPEELARRFGLTFEQFHDDLDWLQLAAIELPDGSQAWLYRYHGDQNAGTFVRVDAHSDLARARVQLERLFLLSEQDILWSAPGSLPRRASFGPA